jgi:RNA polymerase sigma factor (sigma-70 family)
VAQEHVLEQIEALYQARFRDFLRVATATAGSLELGRDAVQDAFVTAIRHHRQFRGEGPLEAWLWRVVVTSALKARRSSNRTPVAEAPSEAREDTPPRDDLHQVREAVAGLPERQRMVLFLRYYADLDYRTIADVLGVRPGTVAAALNAAHRALRGRVQEVLVCD